MIRRTPELDDFERRWARDARADLTYRQAVAQIEALWREAAELDPDFPRSWLHDFSADLELARVLNGLPERS